MGMNDDLRDPGVAALGARPTPVAVVPARSRDEDVSRTVLALYDAHHRELANFVRALERDPRAAEDIVGETFVRLIDAVRHGRVPDQPRAWLHRVAANLVIDGGRRRTVVTRFLGRLVDHRTAPAADESVLRDESRREVWDALATLSPDARTALMLAAHGFSGHEIAEAIGRSDLATRSLLCRARLRLREQLTETEGQP
jgi:RNA polymerase sigma factor (sigma-70 family)